MSLLDEILETFAESWKRQGETAYRAYLRTQDVWEHLDEIYADHAWQIAKSPLASVDKQQAVLNYILENTDEPT